MPDAYHQLLSGANAFTSADGTLVITSSLSRYIGWILVFVLGLPLCLWCWKKGLGGNYAKGFFFALFTVPIIILPSITNEQIKVSETSVVVITGFWFDPTRKIFELPDLAKTDSIKVEKIGGNRNVVLTEWNGDKTFVGLSDLLSGNAEAIASYLVSKSEIKKIEADQGVRGNRR